MSSKKTIQGGGEILLSCYCIQTKNVNSSRITLIIVCLLVLFGNIFGFIVHF